MFRVDPTLRLGLLLSVLLGSIVGLASGCGSGGGGGEGEAAPAPTLTSTTPDTAFAPGGATITLRGSGFEAQQAGPNTVMIGGILAADVEVVDDTTITCTLPAGAVGPVDVEVENANGSVTLLEGVTYYSFPPSFPAADTRVASNDPASGGCGGAQICCDGANVYATWFEYRDLNTDIYFNRSTDGGETWKALATRLDTDDPGSGSSNSPGICCDGSMVYVVWVDRRNGSSDIYFNRSTDGGETWLASDTRLGTDAPGAEASNDPRVCCDGETVYVSWPDHRDGKWDVYFNRSLDGGTTWEASDTRLDTDAPGAADSDTMEMCCDGAYVYVTWEEARNGRDDVYFNGSSDGGATWLATDVRLDTDAPGAERSNQPDICCTDETVYVVWKDGRNGSDDIYLNVSTDGGGTWLSADQRVDRDAPGAAKSASPTICCGGSSLYVAWEDERNGDPDIYLNRSTDGGATWSAADTRLDVDDPAPGRSSSPRICCDGPNVFAAWYDDRNGLRDIYFNVSGDGGMTWQSSDARLDTDAPGAADSRVSGVCCEGADVYVMWIDGREAGESTVYFSTPER